MERRGRESHADRFTCIENHLHNTDFIKRMFIYDVMKTGPTMSLEVFYFLKAANSLWTDVATETEIS